MWIHEKHCWWLSPQASGLRKVKMNHSFFLTFLFRIGPLAILPASWWLSKKGVMGRCKDVKSTIRAICLGYNTFELSETISLSRKAMWVATCSHDLRSMLAFTNSCLASWFLLLEEYIIWEYACKGKNAKGNNFLCFWCNVTPVQTRSNLEWVPGRRQKASNKRSWARALENLMESQKPFKKIENSHLLNQQTVSMKNPWWDLPTECTCLWILIAKSLDRLDTVGSRATSHNDLK